MAKVGAIRRAIESDLQKCEKKEFDFEFMVWYDSVGLVIPHKWIDILPDWFNEYEKFMNGQTVCGGGVYYRDVLNFLNIVESKCHDTKSLPAADADDQEPSGHDAGETE
jgi:hypothetical protein